MQHRWVHRASASSMPWLNLTGQCSARGENAVWENSNFTKLRHTPDRERATCNLARPSKRSEERLLWL